jgi:hypothetical protein
VARGIDVTSETPDPRQSAIETAEELRDDLEAVAASDLPFAYDAERILDELEQAQKEGPTDE